VAIIIENDAPYNAVTYTIGAEAGDAINVAGQFQDWKKRDLAVASSVSFYLADDVDGLTPSVVAPSGGIAIGTNGALIEDVADLSGEIILEADGTFDIDITEAGVATWYLVLVAPDGTLRVSSAITFA
jgi:hypothetical protein